MSSVTSPASLPNTRPANPMNERRGSLIASPSQLLLRGGLALAGGLALLMFINKGEIAFKDLGLLAVLACVPLSMISFHTFGQQRRLHSLTTALAAAETAKAQAEMAARDKARLLATMSHEIRTPLNGVIGMMALLNESQLSSEQRNYGATAEKSARTLLSLIDEILDTAKSEHNDKGISQVELVPFIEGMTELLSPRAHAKGISLSARVAPNVPRHVKIDELHLRQVVFNLAGNAIKFTETGGVALDVSIKGGDLRIMVRDSGIGMTPEEASRVFGEYEQANEDTTRKFGGTGLGLAISKRLVTTMGGKLELASQPGQGSAFTITLPLQTSEVKTEHARPLAHRHYVLAMEPGILCDQLAQSLIDLGAEVSFENTEQGLKDKMVKPAPLMQFICGTAHADMLEDWALRQPKRSTARAVVWVLLRPEERKDHEALLKAPFAGYLLTPWRRASLLAQLAAHDGKSLRATSSAMRKAKSHKAKKPVVAAAPAAGLHILVAEDNAVNALLTRTILERAGHTIHLVPDGGKALDVLHTKEHFDLAILDVQMPHVSGLRVVAEIRARENLSHRRRLPLLAMTANARPEDVKACIDVGFGDHLPKPFDKLDLFHKIEALTRRARAA